MADKVHIRKPPESAKPKRVPPGAIKAGSLNELQLATTGDLIGELKSRVGAMVVAYTKIPHLVIDRKNHTSKMASGASHIDHAGVCVIHGPACLLEGLVDLVQKTAENGLGGSD